MKTFSCTFCGHRLFFENTLCLNCGSRLGYVVNQRRLVALEEKDGAWSPRGEWQRFRLCSNYALQNVCNWLVDQGDPSSLCLACRLNRTVPDMSIDANRERWARLEAAKRRLVVELLSLGLPVVDRICDPVKGLGFDFLVPDDKPVMTGHRAGLITVDAREADDDHREQQRVRFGEPYRTLLGHLRHESGHYYWERLVWDSWRVEEFRALFGDERQDYNQAIQRHHQLGPSPDWAERGYVSSYASSHPWEDWAESWAHYLHLRDALDTAHDLGLTFLQRQVETHFDAMIQQWLDLSLALNSLNRSLGQRDFYPFVLAPQTLVKLTFIHNLLVGS